MLFAFAAAFFAGCILTAWGFINIYILLPGFVLGCFLFFINRKNKSVMLAAALVITLLLSALEYQQMASSQSSLLRFVGNTAVIEGVIASEPTATDYGFKLLLKNVNYVENNKIYNTSEKLMVYVGLNEQLKFGDHIRMQAEVEPIAQLKNFGDFDFKRYYRSKGIYMKAFAKEIKLLASDKGGFLPSLLYSCSEKVKATIYAALPQTEAALLHGILTGSKTGLDEDVMEVFSLTGLAHILSVSGLHIGFLLMMLTYLLRPLKLNNQHHGIIVFVVVLFYIMLIGAPAPALRAMLMLGVALGGKVVGREYDLTASTSFAAILLLIFNPLLIHDPSFIISFACMYSICFLHQPINKMLGFLPGWLRSSLALSIAVWIGIAPVLIHYFNYISVINILLNVLAVPLSFVITLAGFAAVIIGIFLPSAALFIFAAAYYMLKILYYISEKSLLLPFTGFSIPSLSPYVYALYYLAILPFVEDFWKYKSLYFKRSYMAAGIAGLLIIIAVQAMPSSVMKIYFIDVGQGDCSVIRTPNHKTIIVDGGGSSAREKGGYDIGKKVTVPALFRLGIWQVDAAIVSHIHDDHLGGILSVLESFRVKQVILPYSDQYGQGEFDSEGFRKLKAICREKNIPIRYLQSGSNVEIGNTKLRVLAPEKPYLQSTDSDSNNNSLVFKLSYKDFDALFTGDIQQEAEQRLLRQDIQCDVMKIAHHGSPFSSINHFLEQADPEYSVISVGRNNYGHPSSDVIKRLERVGSNVYRTDMMGAVMLTTNGSKLKIETVRP